MSFPASPLLAIAVSKLASCSPVTFCLLLLHPFCQHPYGLAAAQPST
jgi:hypothetical protein